MKISAIELLISQNGLVPFCIPCLGDIVVVSGSNGAGKTRLLKLIEHYIEDLRAGRDTGYLKMKIFDQGIECALSQDNIDKIEVANYSHFDAQLQTPDRFTPYVIHKAKKTFANL